MRDRLQLLDLFSGIGGFSLGLERAGMKTVAFCEIDPNGRRVLAKHWPGVPIYDDVRKLDAARLRADGIGRIDAICGGFPCQDISNSGQKAGIDDGERSGLWKHYARLVGELRPQFVIVENVAALLGRGLGRVLGDLAAIGYDAEWQCLPGPFVGAPQLRDRVWVVAYPQGIGSRAVHAQPRVFRAAAFDRAGSTCDRGVVHRPDAERLLWPPEPALVRVADGFPDRVDRIHGLGNSVIPQIPELIGRAILADGEAA
jgi:DNA (cytosine-5)-methyltransferase 1